MRIILILFILVQVSCSRQSTLTAELSPRLLRAVNLEETLTRRDELMLAYSLTSYDAKNKPVGVVNGGWGIETVQKGQQLDLQPPDSGTATPNPAASPQVAAKPAHPIQLALPRNGRVVASVVLIEVDDYSRAMQLLEQVRRIHNIVSLPASLLLTATEVLTPLKYVAAGLAASGVGLKLVDQLDKDDLIGQSSVDLREADLRQKKQRLVQVPAAFSGQHLHDSFDYRLEYDVVLKTVKIRSARQ